MVLFWFYLLITTFCLNSILASLEVYFKWQLGGIENYFLLAGGIFLMFGINYLWFFAYYHCAYKNPGRKLLAFYLVLSPIAVFTEVYKLITQIKEPTTSVLTWLYFFLPLVVNIFFYISSLKVFKLNKTRKVEKLLSSTEYTSSYKEIISSWDPDVLESRFADIEKKFPIIKKFFV